MKSMAGIALAMVVAVALATGCWQKGILAPLTDMTLCKTSGLPTANTPAGITIIHRSSPMETEST